MFHTFTVSINELTFCAPNLSRPLIRASVMNHLIDLSKQGHITYLSPSPFTVVIPFTMDYHQLPSPYYSYHRGGHYHYHEVKQEKGSEPPGGQASCECVEGVISRWLPFHNEI